MIKKAIMDADYCDLRFVRGRKVVQIVLEIPIEAGAEFIEIFGTPLPDRNVPVAIARLVGKEASHDNLKDQLVESVTQTKPWSDLSRTQQAGITCNEKGFWTFLRETYPEFYQISNAADAATAVRAICCVISRSEFNEDPDAARRWDSFYDRYRAWLKAPV